MKLASIEIAGFRGIKQKLNIQCPSGFLVIVGRNGSGKSTICDAIEYCLTENIQEYSHKEKGESIADYIWWRGRGTTNERFVRVTFVDDKGEMWQVTRTPHGLDDDSYEALSQLCRQDGAPDDPYVGLCRTSIIRDEEITKLSVDLPEGDRYRFVRDALGTVKISDIESRIERVKNIIENRLNVERPSYDRLRNKVADLITRLSNARASLALEVVNLDAERILRDLLNLQEADIHILLEAARQSISQGRLQIDRLHRLFTIVQEIAQQRQEVEAKEFNQRQQELEMQLADTERMLAEQIAECEQFSSVLRQLKQEEPEQAERAELLQIGERLGLQSEERCPLCGSAISALAFSEHIANARHAIAEKSARIVGALSSHNDSTNNRNTLLQKRDRLKNEYKEHIAKRKVFEDSIARAVQEASAAGIPIEDNQYLSSDQVRQEIEVVRGRIQQLEQSVSWLESSRIAEMVQLLEGELQQAKQQSDEAYSAINRMENAIDKLRKATNSIRSLLGEIVDEQLSELSPLIEELYKRLRPHVEWTSIRYQLRGDVRRFMSFEVGDGLNPSFIFSSGQRRAAGLAFLLAVHLSRPWCKWETLVLDDPVQHVDDFRALNLTEVLAAIRKSGRQVVCCVEDEALGQLLCRRLRSASDHDGGLAEMHFDRDSGVMVRRFAAVGPLQSEILIPA